MLSLSMIAMNFARKWVVWKANLQSITPPVRFNEGSQEVCEPSSYFLPSRR